MNPINY